MASMNLAAPPRGLLDLPTSRGIKVEDVVTFKLPIRRQACSQDAIFISDDSPSTGAGLMLVAKACDALNNLGYDDEIAKVCNLVARNLMTVDSLQVMGHVGVAVGLEMEQEDLENCTSDGFRISDIGRIVYLMLKGMLDPQVSRSRSVRVNSNEPILLVNIKRPKTDWRQMGRIMVNKIVDEAIWQLHHDWNICPVRVYAGAFVPAWSSSGGEGFSISLLNVVNTDIGGPSMVQLLDMPCEAPEWNGFLRKEVWRERERSSREDGGFRWGEDREVVRDDVSEKSFQSDGDHMGSTDSLTLAILKSPRRPRTPVSAQAGEKLQEEKLTAHDEADTDEHHNAAWGEQGPSVVESGPVERKQPAGSEMPGSRIKHPTWERLDDNTSLIDLIKSQALTIAPFGREDQSSNEKQDGDGGEPLPAEEEASGDDEFVLV